MKLSEYGFDDISVVCECCAGNIVDEKVKFLFDSKVRQMKIIHLSCYNDNDAEKLINLMKLAKDKIKSMRNIMETLEEANSFK